MAVDTKALKTVEDKLIFAERLADLFTNSFTKKEFVAAFEQIVKIFLALKEQNKSEMASFREEYEKAETMMGKEHEQAMSRLESKLNSALLEKFSLVDARLKELRNGTDGKDANEEKMMSELVQRHEAMMEEMEQELPQHGDKFRDGLELLQGDERLDKSAIKGLEEFQKSLDEKLSRIPRGRLGMRKIPIVKRHNLSSQTDGSTKTFTLPTDTTDVLGVWSTQFPITYNPLTDWTFAGRTLTLTGGVSAPATGQTLWCLIETLFYG